LADEQLTIVPISFKQACRFVTDLHRHHKAPRGQKFAVGVIDSMGKLRGVATCGRPVARAYDDGLTLEVNRSCTDGCRNANSALYGAAWRVAVAMGYTRILTYTQEGETGASMRGAGWKVAGERKARKNWAESSGEKFYALRDPDGPGGVARTLWVKQSLCRELETALPLAWAADTSFDPENWTPDNPAYGQCAVTALVVNDLLGGQIAKGTVNGVEHYWNVLPGTEEEKDLTRHQFGKDCVASFECYVTTDWLLSDGSTTRRYQTLKRNIKKNVSN
jgi:hypothetical protein